MAKTTNSKKSTKKPSTKEPVKSSSGQRAAIIILATVLGTVLITFLVLSLTGIIRFNNIFAPEDPYTIIKPLYKSSNTSPSDNDSKDNSSSNAGTTNGGVTCYNDTRAQVGRLEFCLPKNFTEGKRNQDGSIPYHLSNDDGWAEVKVYMVKSYRSPSQYIKGLSSSLKITNSHYTVNGTTWVRAEAGDYMEAFATKSGDYIYAVYYSIKLDSSATKEAWSMIPKTLTFSS